MADFDLSSLQGLLAQFQPTDADKRAALSQALASAGFGILGARGVTPWQALGQGGLLGTSVYGNALNDASTQKRATLQNAMGALQLKDEMQKETDAEQLRQAQRDFAAKFGSAASPLLPSGVPTSGAPPQMGGGSAAALFNQALGDAPVPAPSAAPAAPATPAAQTPGVPDKRALAQAYQAKGDYWMNQGYPDQAQKFYDLAQKVAPQIKDQQVRVDPQTGQRVVVNVYNDGTQEVLHDVAPDKEKLNFQNTGKAIVGLDPFTGQPQSQGVPVQMSPDQQANLGLGYARLNEEKRHNQQQEGDPDNIEATAQLIARGDMAPPTGFAASRPQAQAIMTRVSQINPSYSASDFFASKKGLQDFSSGKLGSTVRSLNVAISHLDTLGNLSDALNNGDIQLFNKASQAVAQQTGNPAPTNFDAAKQIVGNEIVKAIVGTGGADSDRKEAQQAINRANSPAQLKGVINTYQTLLGGQLHGLSQQYQQSTKRNDFNRFLSPETQRILTPMSAGTDIRSQADKILAGS